MKSRDRHASMLVLCCSLFGCGATAEGEESLGRSEQPIQNSLVSFAGGFPVKWTQLLFSESQSAAGKITGALRFRGKDNLHYSCGVTFISQSYALTAAHCVAKNIIDINTRFRVEQYNTTDLALFNNLPALAGQMTVTGTWPNWTRPDPLTDAEGYKVTQYTDCFTAVACDSGWQRINCPFQEDVDIALIRCPSRRSKPLARNFTSVVTSDTDNRQVEAWWFHEVLNLASDREDQRSDQPPNNFNNYSKLTTNNQNFHYTYEHQLLPLRSTSWPDNTPYQQLGPFSGPLSEGETIMTDIPACKGTSGSGVFERGTTAFIGVINEFGWDSVVRTNEPRICEDMNDKRPRMNLSNHTRTKWSLRLEALSAVQADRQ